MIRTVKVSLFICFLYAFPLSGQTQFTTTGLFTFQRSLPIPDTYEIGPGQLTKDGSAFMLGLIDGDLENYVDLHSDLYAYSVLPDAPPMPLTAFNLNNPVDSLRIFQVSASQNEEHIVFVVNAYSGWNDNELAIADKLPNGQYSDMRLLPSVNTPEVSDAYPWLSADALRLYFTNDFKLMYTERSSLQTDFATPKAVAFTGAVNLEIVSVWLTPDENTMFLIAGNQLYKSSRKSTDKPFDLPVLYSNEFKDFYFISGMSFAPDKKTMYLYYSDETTQYILHYTLKKGKAW